MNSLPRYAPYNRGSVDLNVFINDDQLPVVPKGIEDFIPSQLAAEWAPYGIRVNALVPGCVRAAIAPVDDPRSKPRWVDGPARQPSDGVVHNRS